MQVSLCLGDEAGRPGARAPMSIWTHISTPNGFAAPCGRHCATFAYFGRRGGNDIASRWVRSRATSNLVRCLRYAPNASCCCNRFAGATLSAAGILGRNGGSRRFPGRTLTHPFRSVTCGPSFCGDRRPAVHVISLKPPGVHTPIS